MSLTRDMLAGLLICLGLAGCQQEIVEAPPDAPPPPTYSGPEFLRSTVASLVKLDGYHPVLVSGYGLVVNLNHTGSADCPPALRQWLIDEMSKRGFGSESAGYGNLTPAQVLASDRTAVVKVQGVIPPGATEGTRFDLMVTALEQTQTTSLEGGLLYTTTLSIGQPVLGAPAFDAVATGRGQLFLNPFRSSAAEADSESTVGRVLAGGVTTQSLPLQLLTNQPSYRLTRQVADRINGRFPPDPGDKQPIAVPKSDTVIAINVVGRYKDNPQRMLDLCSHLYLNPTASFAQQKARELAELIRQPGNYEYADDIAIAFEGMGKTILPTLRAMYSDGEAIPRITALKAGAYLGDQTAVEPLYELAGGGHGPASEQATRMLGVLLRERPDNLRAATLLRKLVDVDDVLVRVAAAEALAEANDPSIRQFAFGETMMLTQVKCDRPMIYVSRTGKPRVIVFNDQLGFQYPLFFSTENSRFMIRGSEGEPEVAVFYQSPELRGAVNQNIPANVGYLIGTMAFSPDADSKTVGLGIGYSRIVSVLHALCTGGFIDAPFVLQQSDLAQRIADTRALEPGPRPETGAPGAPGADPQIIPDGPVVPRRDSGDNAAP